jgi:alpha-L-fucosidase
MSWFDECRYGMFVHANIATVPAFAPLHEYADWYWAFLEPKPDVVLHPTCPLPEVVTWHREHHGDRPFDDFIPALTFERFDADRYAELMDAAGMRYLVHVAKHHDGFCWWDASHTGRNSVRQGPRRDVVAELAAAVRRRGHVFGTYYSLLDWAHPAYPDRTGYVDAFMRPQIRELVERYEPAVLWGDGHWGHPGDHWRADELVAEVKSMQPDLVVNDRFFASDADFAVYEYDVPSEPPDGPWELCRGLAYSFCFNRVERDEDHLQPRDVVALLVETVAKGGNLLLNVGPRADGTLPEIQERVLREAGEWVNRNAEAIHGAERFDVPGAGRHWYTRAGGHVHAFDLGSAPEPRFRDLGHVVAVTTPEGVALPFTSTNDAEVLVDARAVERHPFGTRYRIDVAPAERIRVRDETRPAREWTITSRLAAAEPGEVVALPAGVYDAAAGESFPLVVPDGVTLRAEEGTPLDAVVIDSGTSIAVQLGAGSTLQGLTVRGGAPGYMMIPPTCVTGAGDRITIRRCALASVMISGGGGHVVANNVIAGGKVWLAGTNASTVHGNYQHGLRWGAGIEVNGGDGHVVGDNECDDDLCAVRLTGTTNARVERNRYRTRWFGIHLFDTHGTRVERNSAEHTMRAVSIEGGSDNTVTKQFADRCDSGVVVERGAAGVTVERSWFHDCRVGLLVFEAAPVAVTDTTGIDGPE